MKAQTPNARGYLVVNLWRANKGRVLYVHDLVAAAFIGPKPIGLTVNHIDGDKTNNLPSNLEYITKSENSKHSARLGLNPRGERNGSAKLSADQVREIRRRAEAGERGVDLSAEFGVGQVAISQIRHRQRWAHLA